SDVGGLDSKESLSVLAMPGGNETVFQNGTKDKDYNIQVNAKSKSQFNCIEALSKVARELEELKEGAIVSENESFDFESINTTSFVSIVGQDEQGFFIYQ